MMMPLTIHTQSHSSPLYHLQRPFPLSPNVCAHGSEYPYRCAHSPTKFGFIDPNLCVGSGLHLFHALFCVSATVINEASGPYIHTRTSFHDK